MMNSPKFKKAFIRVYKSNSGKYENNNNKEGKREWKGLNNIVFKI